MILIRKIATSIFSHHPPFPLYYPLTTTSNRMSPLPQKQMPIQKILKASSSKKYTSVQDVMFCALVLELFARNRVVDRGEEIAMGKQVGRILGNSLKYINELSLAESLVLTNNLLELLQTEKINIDGKLLSDFMVKINKNIEIGMERDKDGKYASQIIKYVMKLAKNKKLITYAKDIISNLITQVKSQQQVLQIMTALSQIKIVSNLIISKQVQRLLDKHISRKIDSLPLKSPLINYIVLTLFTKHRLQVKEPYNCVPLWMFNFMEKIIEKFCGSQFGVTQIERIYLLQSLFDLFTDTILISQCSFTQGMLKSVPQLFSKIAQSFDYLDQDPMSLKVHRFLELVHSYLNFLEVYPMFEIQAVVSDIFDGMNRVFDRYLQHLKPMDLEQSEQAKVCTQIRLFSQILRILGARYKDVSRLVLIQSKNFNKLAEKYSTALKKYKSTPERLSIYMPLLSQIILLSKNPELKQISTKNKASSLLQETTKIALNEWKNTEMTDSSTKAMAFIIANCHASFLTMFGKTNEGLEKVYKQILDQNLLAIIQSELKYSISDDIAFSISGILKKRLQVWHQSSNLSNRYKQIPQAKHLPHLFATRPYQKYLKTQIFTFWITENPHLLAYTLKISINSWNNLRSCLRYLNRQYSSSAVDLLAEVMRLSFDSQDPDKLLMLRYTQIFNDRSIYNVLLHKIDQFAEYKYSWLVGLLADCAFKVKNSKNQFQRTDLLQRQQENDSPNEQLSLYKLIQVISFCAQDSKSPLQLSSYRSAYICNLLNSFLNKLVAFLRQNSVSIKAQQCILCTLPMEQIVYFFKQNNFQPIWVDQIDPAYILSFMQNKYDQISLYNTLLSFNFQKQIVKRTHQNFITQEMNRYGCSISQEVDIFSNDDIFKSTVLKFYFYLLASGRNNENIEMAIELLKKTEVISGQQVLIYWKNKSIVMKTSDDRLIEVMLQRLMSIAIEITYIQFVTALNTIISLFKIGRIQNYRKSDPAKVKDLEQWIHYNFLIFSQNKLSPHFLDYLTIRKYFSPISILQPRVSECITKCFCQNKIDILNHLYEQKCLLNHKNIHQMKEMLLRLRMRSMLEDYYGLEFNQDFKVDVILGQIWGIAIFQDNPQLLNWIWENIFDKLESDSLKEYLLREQNRNKVYGLVIKYKLSQKILNKVPKSSLYSLLQALSLRFQAQIQQAISKTQGKRFKKISGNNFTLESIKQTGITLFKQQNTLNYFYLIENKQQTRGEQHLQFLYIKSLAKDINILVKSA